MWTYASLTPRSFPFEDDGLDMVPSGYGVRFAADQKRAQHQLLQDLAAVFSRYDRAGDGTAVVQNTYLRAVAVRA
jgi:hypothetical protein